MNKYHELFIANRNGSGYLNINGAIAEAKARHTLVQQYAWAVPSDEAIKTIVEFGPIVEVGAGTGYWASLIAKEGCDIICYDAAPPDSKAMNFYGHKKGHFPVEKGYPSLLKYRHRDRALMLCWPPFKSDMASRALTAYKGDTLIYIGEDGVTDPYFCCTGDREFFYMIREQFEEVKRVTLPNWDGIHDDLFVYKRKERVA